MSELYEEGKILESNRLILRPMELSDKVAIFNNICHDKDVIKYYLMGYKETLDEFDFAKLVNFYKQNKMYYLAVVEKESNNVIGMIHLCNLPSVKTPNVEIGYAYGKKYWNKGYATEALNTFIEFLKTKEVHRICAGHLKENTASGRVMQKCGMEYECTKKEEIFYNNRYYDVCYYYLINPNF